jgi:Fibronectin type III-like domain
VETKRVSFPVEAGDLAYYNPQGSGWEVEEIRHTVSVGASLRDIRLTDSFQILSSP